MLIDFTDPVGTIQMIIGIVILVELIQLLDKDNLTEHIQGRVTFYNGILGSVWGILVKVGGFLKVAGSGFQIIFSRIFPKKEKDQEPEEEGGIEG